MPCAAGWGGKYHIAIRARIWNMCSRRKQQRVRIDAVRVWLSVWMRCLKTHFFEAMRIYCQCSSNPQCGQLGQPADLPGHGKLQNGPIGRLYADANSFITSA